MENSNYYKKVLFKKNYFFDLDELSKLSDVSDIANLSLRGWWSDLQFNDWSNRKQVGVAIVSIASKSSIRVKYLNATKYDKMIIAFHSGGKHWDYVHSPTNGTLYDVIANYRDFGVIEIDVETTNVSTLAWMLRKKPHSFLKNDFYPTSQENLMNSTQI